MAEAGIYPFFSVEPVHMENLSEKEGRPIYHDVEMVRIVIAGDNKTEIVRKVKDDDRNRWPQEYAAFKRGEERALTGTPVEEWPAINRSQAMELKHLRILTVEMLAAVPDTALQGIGMGARELRAKAQAFLAASKDTAEAQRYAAENERLKDQMADMQRQIRELGALLKKDEAA